MNGEYSKYLLIIILMLTVIPFLYILLKRGGRVKRKEKNEVVIGGNISLFFDRDGNLTVIPYVKDKYGNGRATANVEFLKAPYGRARLGSLAKKSMNGCISDKPCTNKELIGILGSLDWKQFSEGRRNISLYFREGYGLIFNTTTRKTDGAYQFNYNGIEHSLSADVSDDLLGSTLLKLLEKCR